MRDRTELLDLPADAQGDVIQRELDAVSARAVRDGRVAEDDPILRFWVVLRLRGSA